MRKLAFLVEMSGVGLIVAGIAHFSVWIASIAFGVLLIAAIEVHA